MCMSARDTNNMSGQHPSQQIVVLFLTLHGLSRTFRMHTHTHIHIHTHTQRERERERERESK